MFSPWEKKMERKRFLFGILLSTIPYITRFSSRDLRRLLCTAPCFQLLRFHRVIKGTDRPSTTRRNKIGWKPHAREKARFCRTFHSYEQFRGRVLSHAHDSVIAVYILSLVYCWPMMRPSCFRWFIGIESRCGQTVVIPKRFTQLIYFRV
jgi:hypothetical protein